MGIEFDKAMEQSKQVFFAMPAGPQTDLYGTPTYNSAWHAATEVVEDMPEPQRLTLFQEIANEGLDRGLNLAEVTRYKTKLSLAELVLYTCQDVVDARLMRDPDIRAETTRRMELLDKSLKIQP